MVDLQRIVDDLALRLGRPLLLEDGRQRVVAYSEQDGPMDDVRRHSILRRHTTPDVRAFLRAAGIHEATRPLRTPGAPELGLLPRVCVPVRHDGLPLGFLWFIDAAPAMTEPEITIAAEAAPALALTLFHESLATELASRRELEAVTGLLLREPDADRTLIEAGAFPHNAPVTVAVARPACGGTDETLRLTLERGLLALRRRLARHHPLHLVRFDHAVLLTAGTTAFPEEMHAALGTPVLVGVGSPRPSLSLAAGSYEEALHAVEVVANVPEFGAPRSGTASASTACCPECRTATSIRGWPRCWARPSTGRCWRPWRSTSTSPATPRPSPAGSACTVRRSTTASAASRNSRRPTSGTARSG